MRTISIPIADDHLLRLKELAQEASLSPEELLRWCVEEWLADHQSDFAVAAAYVLQKNAAIYRRLAQ